MSYRTLTTEEIKTLQGQGCFADNWNEIWVKEGFIPASIINVRFSGKIKLGILKDRIECDKGILKSCGLYNSYIQNCEIGDNVYIADTKNLCNYTIADDVVIENVGTLAVHGETTFGNGVEIEVFNEGGGRELPIFDKLSSQIAYLTVVYRHDKELISRLQDLIGAYTATKKSATGCIGTGTRIINTSIIRNVKIGASTLIYGALLLEEGTIRSNKEAPVTIGEGVIAKKFIILSGSKIESSAIVDKTFIGQGVKIGKQYSAENSAFFANCEGFHGEACSLFAGPYTVSHHKSTLMIAGMFSFFNAGSGTNQSNHMYKLGPLHQGILERGSKTGSFSYLLWPCRIGAFTAVVGKHYSNFDTGDFPFSYITEEKGRSILTPAMNLFTVGTRRDSEKWPARDRRKDTEKLDLIHFDWLGPYIMGKVVNAIQILNELGEKASKTQEFVNYKGININRLLLKTTRKYYEMILKIYIGREVIKRLENIGEKSTLDLINHKLTASGKEVAGKWVELSGMYAPASKVDEVIVAVKNGSIKSTEELHSALKIIFDNYETYSWDWCSQLISKISGNAASKLPLEILKQIIMDWKDNAIKLNNMIIKDAEKEFDANSKIGFGTDGDENTKNADFQSVRGSFETNKFVTGLKKESEEIDQKAVALIEILDKIK